MIAFIKRNPLVALMLVSVLMLFSNLGMIQTNIMETRNLITAREMVNNGHWIFTTMNGLPRYEKPPLPTWITALFMMLFGMQNMFLLRLPAALICLMLVYFFYRLIQFFKLENNQPLNASLILITSFYIFFGGRDNQWDIYTHAFIMPCLFYLFRCFNGDKGRIKHVLLSGLFLACSCLSKGPVSLYALFLPAVIAYFIVYRNNTGKNIKLFLLVLLIGLLLGFSWYFYVKYFDTTAGSALSKQTENWSNYEVKPFYYYWSFFTQSGIWTVPSFIALMYFYLLRHVTDKKAYTFSFLWTILSFVLLSLIPEKKQRYTLPILIPLAMNTSFYIQYLITNFKQIKNRFEAGLVYFNFGLIALIGLAAPFAAFFMFKSKLSGYFFWYVLLSVICFAACFFIIRSLYKKEFAQTFYTSILFMCGIVTTVIPLSKMFYTNTQFYPAFNLNLIEKKYHIKTYEVNGFEPELIWNYGAAIPNVKDNDTVTEIPKDAMFGLLLDPEKEQAYMNKFKNYSFTKSARVDINFLPEHTNGYGKRLVKNYYIVKKLN